MFIIGICGPSGSGKTTLARKIQLALGDVNTSIISQDAYYKDRSHFSDEKKFKCNFDDPITIDFELLTSHIRKLKESQAIQMPVYTIETTTREKHTITINPTKLVIIEGHLIFSVSELLNIFNLKIFIDTPLDVCLHRRIHRQQEADIALKYTINNYSEQIRPSYKKFIKPYKEEADIILHEKFENLISLLKFSLQKTTNTYNSFYRNRQSISNSDLVADTDESTRNVI